MFTIDGESFPNICVQNITRGFEINDGKNEGYSISGLHMRDITGTYMTYTVVLDASLTSPADYDKLYEILSSPTEYHTIVFPYGQKTLSFEAEVTQGADNLVISEPTYNLWQDLSFTFRSRKPVKKPT